MKAHTPPFDDVDDVDKRPREDSDELHRRIPDAFDEDRIDIVAQNGNEGEHYEFTVSSDLAAGQAGLRASEKQVGGSHYTDLTIQPLDNTYATYGYLGYKAAIHTMVDKYLKRKKDNEVQDIQKAIHCLELLLEKAKGDA